MPWALLASTYLAFVGLEELLGPTRGYLAAFVVYWVGWCLLFPLWFLGKKELKRVLSPVRFSRSGAMAGGLVLLAVPPVLALATVFVTKIPQATVAVVLGSLGLAAVNGTAEEVLWRGVYIREFPGDMLRGFLYPTLGFALWHLAPQAVHPLS
ncbi:MAG TPA: hypothetical protein ENN54_06565, partial [Thermoplasmatales archaeon]|nr:hypothetical protein [Thermoplasmatales archaeon]